jgi:GDPmannose 4,6-dehydratase
VEALLGDPSRPARLLGWRLCTTVSEMVAEMVKADFESARRDQVVTQAGFRAFDYNE